MKNHNIKNTIKTTRYMFSAVLRKKHGKAYVFLKTVIAVVDALFPIVFVIIPGLLIDELLLDQDITRIACYIFVLCLSPIIIEVFRLLMRKKITALRLNLDTDFSVDFYSHIADMDFETTESPEIQTLKGRAQETLESSVTIVDSILNLMSAFIRLLSLSAIIAMMNPIIILIIIIQVYLNAAVSKWVNRRVHNGDIELSKMGRKIYAATCVFDDNDYAKELRIFDIKSYIINLFIKNKNDENAIWMKIRNSQFTANMLTVFIKGVQQCFVYIYLVYDVIAHALPIGNLTIYLASVDQFSGALGNFMSTYVDLIGRSYKVDELITFMNIPLKQLHSGTRIPCINKDSVIEFRNVSFQYPGSDKYALQDFNMTIRLSEKLCIVGKNGSGKSTFIKLLTRLYFPVKGEILLDGININEYDYKQYQALFASVFQDFQLFFMSLRQNVCLSDEVHDVKLKKAYIESDLENLIQTLPHSDETQVYKWECEDGFEPSGGEGQKIAIARALYRNGEIYLLDEPTAALDPEAEYEIYMKFHNMISGKCAVLITHRLSAVQLADKVAVFDNGHVAEYGTHAELYAKGGIYTEMFDKQAQFYRDAPQETESKTAE